MSAKLFCIYAAAIGATVSACLPISSNDEDKEITAEASENGKRDTPLELVIFEFPSGFQGRWAVDLAACRADPENNEGVISLQGRLVKFHETIATMIDGKRETSSAMIGNFEFVGEGEKWMRSMRFKLSPDRENLTRIDTDDGSSIQYRRCKT
ncbi:MAG: hypothetical protein WBO17_02315 [Sphingorhabdus sp.]